MRKRTIWVIDDDPIYQIIVKKIIEKTEMFSPVISFPNGMDAIIALKKAYDDKELVPDIILLDIDMPVLDGWGFLEEMAAIKSKTANKTGVYIASSSIAAEDKQKARTYSDILGYLSKPVTLDDLLMIAAYI